MGFSFWSARSSTSHTQASMVCPVDHLSVTGSIEFAEQPSTCILPGQLSGAPLELIEMVDDSSNDDNTDIDQPELAHHISFDLPLHLVSSDNLLLHLSESLQTRPSTDLFMLHHCWRSFLI